MRAVEFIIREEKIQDGSMANFALSSSLEHILRDDARFFSSGGPFSMSDRKAALFFYPDSSLVFVYSHVTWTSHGFLTGAF